MKQKFIRILLILVVWAIVTWIFREKLLPLPKPESGPPPHFRSEAGTAPGAQSSLASQTLAGTGTGAETAVPASPEDDLQLVKGIGPVYQHRLADIGITTFDQLLDADPSKVAEQIDVSESQVHEWIGQARELHD